MTGTILGRQLIQKTEGLKIKPYGFLGNTKVIYETTNEITNVNKSDLSSSTNFVG